MRAIPSAGIKSPVKIEMIPMDGKIVVGGSFTTFSGGTLNRIARVNADGSSQKFQVSGEPMFNQACSFVGYRGIGVELITKR